MPCPPPSLQKLLVSKWIPLSGSFGGGKMIEDMVVLVSRKCRDHWLALAQTNQGGALMAKNWSPPPENWIKVSVDAAFSNGTSISALVFKDSSGSITFAAAYKHQCLDPLAAESLAILEACKELEKQDIFLAIIESDCLNDITFINVTSQNGSWTAAPLIEKIRRYKLIRQKATLKVLELFDFARARNRV
ncbi:hypothetical protein CASFOL_005292 [Castilleja foliolosa]|uniref:RNase H type-1 domain-containing protein n=1 Tax=Castilleja foliolosa TaxID=1961234 RepID=A0ABD3E720_9LAMI